MTNLYTECLTLANYEIENNIPLDIQVKNLFFDLVDGSIYSDITCQEEAEDFIEEIGLEKIAKTLIRKMKVYKEHKERANK